MSHEIHANYDQAFLLPPSLEDWVPPDHPARFIRDFVDSLDLEGLGFRVGSSQTGRPNYSSELLLKVWLYGYFSKIRSSRPLEKACRENMGCIWLTGMNAPDHNTLWRFVHRHRPLMKKVFQRSVEVAIKADMVGLAIHAVDGTKIQAASSRRTGLSRRELNRLLKESEASIEEMLRSVDGADEDDDEGFSLPDRLRNAKERKKKIEEALKELDQKDLNYYHPGEPEARMMKVGLPKEFAYNAQIVVDGESGLIVAEDVSNRANDQKNLPGMLEAVEKNLGQTASETVADGGYFSEEGLAEVEDAGHEVTVAVTDPSATKAPYHSSRFEYDKKQDVCTCPLGNALVFEQIKNSRRRNKQVRVYRCKNGRECPSAKECTRDQRGRSIEISPYHEAVERQRLKNREGPFQVLLRLRKQIAELPFAQVKWNMGFRRWAVRGLAKVQSQWSLICTASNLQKLYTAWKTGRLCLARV